MAQVEPLQNATAQFGIDIQSKPVFKHELPRVIRPDILLTDEGFSITELDSVPGEGTWASLQIPELTVAERVTA